MPKLKRYERIFSGNNSVELWEDIGKTEKKSRKVHEALYSLGCYCQRLEGIVSDLEKRVAELET